MTRIVCALAALALCRCAFAAAIAPADSRRIDEIAALLPEKPQAVSPDHAPNGSAKALEKAVEFAAEPVPAHPLDLYMEFWTTGDRMRYQDWLERFLHRFNVLVAGEAFERKGRFLRPIEARLTAFCDWPSWVLPAHDRKKDVIERRLQSIDLFSSRLTCILAETLCGLGEALSPEVVARVRKEMKTRTFEPYLRFAGGERSPRLDDHFWWFATENNWNAVCHSCCVRAALAAIPGRRTRARFVEAAERASGFYLGGFTDDGYCSEGMGYWDYGFGHYLAMGLAIRKATGGRVDFFKSPKARTVMRYPFAYQLQRGQSPRFADGGGNADVRYLRWGCEIWPELKAEMESPLPLRSVFPDGQVWILRASPDVGRPLALALKGGHNAEMHNHNDVGSYTIMHDGKFVTGDPGGEVYTARTFSVRRYESDVLNSFGHPVPRVGGELQPTGRGRAARLLATDFADAADSVSLDLTDAYSCKALRSLVRTFSLDRRTRAITVADRVRFTEPTAFDDPLIFGGDESAMDCEVRASGGEWRWQETRIANPGRADVLRRAVTFDRPITEGEVVFTIRMKADAAAFGR